MWRFGNYLILLLRDAVCRRILLEMFINLIDKKEHHGVKTFCCCIYRTCLPTDIIERSLDYQLSVFHSSLSKPPKFARVCDSTTTGIPAVVDNDKMVNVEIVSVAFFDITSDSDCLRVRDILTVEEHCHQGYVLGITIFIRKYACLR